MVSAGRIQILLTYAQAQERHNVTRFSVDYICLGTRLGVISPTPETTNETTEQRLLKFSGSENKHFNCTAQSDAMKFII